MKNKLTQLQQGDVLLKRVENINIQDGKKAKRDPRGIVLAEGEVTGHYHGIECDESEAELIQIGEKMQIGRASCRERV